MRYYLDTEFIERGHEHPIELISLALVREDEVCLHATLSDGWNPSHAGEWVTANVLPLLDKVRFSRSYVANAIREWLAKDAEPEFWGYFADYDWVVFCQLFGRMVDLPSGFPMFCRDLMQEAKRLGLHKAMKEAVPQVGRAHDALADALTLKARHKWLMARSKQEGA